MQLRMHHQEEEMRRRQQENTLFMQVGLIWFICKSSGCKYYEYNWDPL
jgi:hypothetical protein